MTSMFLEKDELARLTGRKTKSKQIAALRSMGIPFFVNACGHPIVTRVAVEGRPSAEKAPEPRWEMPRRRWVPNVLKDKPNE